MVVVHVTQSGGRDRLRSLATRGKHAVEFLAIGKQGERTVTKWRHELHHRVGQVALEVAIATALVRVLEVGMDAPVRAEKIVRRLLTPGLFSTSKRTSASLSVMVEWIFLAETLGRRGVR